MRKLSYEDKKNIYYDRKKHMTLSAISKKYKTTYDNITFLVRLIDKHGFDILTTRRSYSDCEKERIIKRVINGETIISVAIDEGVKSKSRLSHWVQDYKENCYNIVERKRGCPAVSKANKEKSYENDKEKIERLEAQVQYLSAELEYRKKLRAVVQARKNRQQKKK